MARLLALNVKWPILLSTFKTDACVLKQGRGERHVTCNRVTEFCGYLSNTFPVQKAALAPAKTDQRHAHRSALIDPRLVTPGVKDAGVFSNRIQHCAVGTAANALRGNQTCRAQAFGFNGQPGFVKPIANQVSAAGDAARKHRTQRFKVGIPQLTAFFAAAQKRWIPNHHAGLGPGSFDRLSPNGVIGQQRIATLNIVQRLQHGVGLELVAMRQPPLQLANPHGHAGQFSGVFVQLNAQHVVRAGHQIGLAVQAHRRCVQMAFVFYVFKGFQPQKQKVAAAASRVKHAVVF